MRGLSRIRLVSSPCVAGGGREGVLFLAKSEPLPNPPLLRKGGGQEQQPARRKHPHIVAVSITKRYFTSLFSMRS